jgi:hypothetical protein
MIQDEPVRWQFDLAHLFGLTTLAAIAAALLVSVGPGALMTSAGLLVAWLNACGLFYRFQRGRQQTALLWAAWASFLVSLALPVGELWKALYGYQAAGIFLLFAPWSPWSVANILMAFLPLIVWRINRGQGQWLSVVLCVTMASAWSVCWSSSSWSLSMSPGYYVWCASFFLALLALPVRHWMLAAMIVVAVASGVLLRPPQRLTASAFLRDDGGAVVGIRSRGLTRAAT